MFGKLLIANRGEIAVPHRAHRAASRHCQRRRVLGGRCATPPHVAACDEAHAASGRRHRLRATYACDALIEAAHRCGAQAIHPGYGFLAENAAFARACAQAGLLFVGPPAHAIARLGSKAAAKALAQGAGVPVVPGYSGDDQRASVLQHEADAMGYPLLIKAGGRRRRQGHAPRGAESADLPQRSHCAARGPEQLRRRSRDAREISSPQPRHVEVQLFADTHGHVLHLFERDCSVQRRHQKVLEEAPAPHCRASGGRRWRAPRSHSRARPGM